MIRDGVAATVITGNSADLIQDALKSVSGKVATCFLIDTGVSDETIELANQSFAGPVHFGRPAAEGRCPECGADCRTACLVFLRIECV